MLIYLGHLYFTIRLGMHYPNQRLSYGGMVICWPMFKIGNLISSSTIVKNAVKHASFSPASQILQYSKISEKCSMSLR